jgi:hypothetical protein
MNSRPLSSWDQNNPPLWWTANNKIKHHRDTEYKKASFKNAFNSLSGLYLITLYYYKNIVSVQNNHNVSWPDTTNYLVPEARLLKLQQEYYTTAVRAYPPEW